MHYIFSFKSLQSLSNNPHQQQQQLVCKTFAIPSVNYCYQGHFRMTALVRPQKTIPRQNHAESDVGMMMVVYFQLISPPPQKW